MNLNRLIDFIFKFQNSLFVTNSEGICVIIVKNINIQILLFFNIIIRFYQMNDIILINGLI